MLPHALIAEKKGRLLGSRYLIREVLAEGGMSFVLAGTDTRTERPIAIKYLRFHNAGRAKQRFANEIQTIRRLRHPNIVKLLDSGEDEQGIPYLVMKLLEGISLEKELLARSEIGAEQTLEWLLPVMGALCHAHDNAVVHRDLKPDNIFLASTEGGEIAPVLLDFGISLLTDATRVTGSGKVVGSVQYMSPEQVKAEPVGAASDVWAMGVVFFKCLTGKLPFEGETPANVLYQIVNERAPKLMSMNKGVGPRFCAAVDRALAKDVSRRYQDMREFSLALCMSARDEHITVPEDPDPIGLPEWTSWYRGQRSEAPVVQTLEETQTETYQRVPGAEEMRGFPTIRPLGQQLVDGYRADDARMGSQTAFVGRRKELEQLLEAFGKAIGGAGQVIGIRGEAGVGKTRLLSEMKKLIDQREYQFLESACQQQYGSTKSYLPILNLLRSFFQLEEGEDPIRVKRVLGEKVTQLDQTLADSLPVLSELFIIEEGREALQRINVKERKRLVWETISRLLARISREKPLVIAVEDLHWIDKSSQEFLEYFINSLSETPILLILLFRYEYSDQITNLPYCREVTLSRLDAEESKSILQFILGQETAVDFQLQQLVWNRARGNPFFIEELTQTLIETGAIQKRDNGYYVSKAPTLKSTPQDLHEIVGFRLEHLEQTAKQTLQMASVVGVDFFSQILKQISGMQDELESQLKNLQRMQFIYSKGSQNKSAFVFKHALIQQTAYESLPEVKRKDIHSKTANALEERYSGNLQDFYETLAYHYTNALDSEKAYHYMRLSGDKASRSYSYEAAIQFYQQAIATFERSRPSEENQRQQLELLAQLNSLYFMLGYPPESLSNMEEMERLSKALGDSKSLALSYSVQNFYYALTGDEKASTAFAELTVEEALNCEDMDILGPSITSLFVVYVVSGRLVNILKISPRAIERFERTERTADSFNFFILTYPWICTCYGCALGWVGRFGEGESMLEKALEVALREVHLPTVGLTETFYSFLYLIKGDAQSCIEHSKRALENFERSGWSWATVTPLAFLGAGYLYKGDLEAARTQLERAFATLDEVNVTHASFFPYFFSSLVSLESCDYKQAFDFAEKAVHDAEAYNLEIGQALAQTLMGIALGISDPSRLAEAEEIIEKAYGTIARLGARAHHALYACSYGWLYAGTNQKERALERLEKLQQSITDMEELQLGYWLVKTRGFMDALFGNHR